MTKPHEPPVPTPPPDEDPTGVRALLSSLPAPGQMPEHLVERISASLAAEQSKRVERTSESSVTPIFATARRRRGRLLFAVAGAAAALAMATVVGNSVLNPAQLDATAGRASATSSADGPEAAAAQSQAQASTSYKRATSAPGDSAASVPRGAVQTDKSAAAAPSAGGLAGGVAGGVSLDPVQIRVSATRYTSAHFTQQATALGGATLAPIQPARLKSAAVGPLGTSSGLTDCLKAIGAGKADVVRADIAFYEGQPAVVIVATTQNKPVAYAVGRQCSHTAASVLRSATPLR